MVGQKYFKVGEGQKYVWGGKIILKGVLNPNFRPFSFGLKKKLDFLK